MLRLHAVTDEYGHLLENEDESCRRLCEYWSTIFQARNEGERHHHCETILRYVQKALDDIRWEIDGNEFDELIATKNESAPGPDGIPKSLYRCAGGLGSRFLHIAYKHVLEGGVIPALFAESRTVFISKSSDVCRGIKPCTSYSRTNDYVKLWLRHCVQLYAQQHHA